MRKCSQTDLILIKTFIWDVSNVVDMSSMFSHAISFNQQLNRWDVSNVFSMENMFSNASNFDQDLSSWNVSGVNEIGSMFYKHLILMGIFPIGIYLTQQILAECLPMHTTSMVMFLLGMYLWLKIWLSYSLVAKTLIKILVIGMFQM